MRDNYEISNIEALHPDNNFIIFSKIIMKRSRRFCAVEASRRLLGDGELITSSESDCSECESTDEGDGNFGVNSLTEGSEQWTLINPGEESCLLEHCVFTAECQKS